MYTCLNNNDALNGFDLAAAVEKEKNGALTKRLDDLQKFDTVKVAYVPFATLGAEMVSHVPVECITKDVLVISDLGLFVSVLRARKGRETSGKVVFLCHHSEHQKYTLLLKSVGIEPVFVPYEKFGLFFSASSGYNLNDMKFDVIVGNPPFNPDISKHVNEGSGSGEKIWQKFIELAFSLVKNDGHLLFVTPHNWRQGNFKTRSQHRKAQASP